LVGKIFIICFKSAATSSNILTNRRRKGERNRNEDSTEKTTTLQPEIPNLCDGNVDVVTNIRKEIFIFKGEVNKRSKEIKLHVKLKRLSTLHYLQYTKRK
jgi:hypothetical protein